MNGNAEIVGSLKIDPEFGSVPKVAGQTQRGIGIERASAVYDLAQPADRDFQLASQIGRAHV